MNTIKRENAGILQLGVNENAILASICITGRSLEIDWGIMSFSRPQLWLFWPVLWNGVASILGRLQKAGRDAQLLRASPAEGHRTIKLLLLSIRQRC